MANTISYDTVIAGLNLGSSSASPSLTTSGSNRLAVLFVGLLAGTVSSVTASGLTWTFNSGLTATGSTIRQEIWTAPVPSSISSLAVTVNLSTSTDAAYQIVPCYLTAGATSVPTISVANTASFNTSNPTSSITTVYADDQVLAACTWGTMPGPSAGSGYTSLSSQYFYSLSAYQTVEIANAYTASPGAVSVPFSTSSSTYTVIGALALNGTISPPSAPAAPTVSSVTAGGCQVNPGVLTTGATSCNIQVTLSSDTGYASPVVTITGATPSANNAITSLTGSTNYITRVGEVNGAGTTYGSSTSLTTLTAPTAPVAPTVSGITVNGCQINPGALTANATSLNIQVTLASDTGFASPVVTITGATASANNTVTGLSSAVNYIARAQAVGNGATVNGPTTAFTTTTAATPGTPTAPAVSSITNVGCNINPGALTTNAVTCNIQVTLSTDTGFASPVVTLTGAVPSTNNAITGLSPLVNYIARVQMSDYGIIANGSATAFETTSPSGVTNLNDSGTGSLRAAITYGNSNSGAIISFQSGLSGTIALASALPTITTNMTITGPGASIITINGAGAYLPFTVNATSSTVAISGLTVTNGYGTSQSGVYNEAGTLNMTGVTITACGSSSSYAFYNSASATLTNCQIVSNLGWGIYTSSSLTMLACTVALNGTAGITSSGTLSLTNMTIAANSGVGISSMSGTITATNCTFSANTSYAFSGFSATVTIKNCILWGDYAGSSEISGLSPTVTNSCIQGGYTGTGNISTNPLLSSLGSGMLPPGSVSPVMGAGNHTGAPTTDARGVTRPNPPSMGAWDTAWGDITLTGYTTRWLSTLPVVGGGISLTWGGAWLPSAGWDIWRGTTSGGETLLASAVATTNNGASTLFYTDSSAAIQNAIQTIVANSVTGAATITVPTINSVPGGSVTVAIGEMAASLQTALQAIGAIGSGNVVVTGSTSSAANGLDSYTDFLCNFDGGNFSTAIADLSGTVTPTLQGSAWLSTSQSVFGPSSLYLPAASSTVNYCRLPYNVNYDNFGSNNFTIDGWFYPTGYSDPAGKGIGLAAHRPSGGDIGGWELYTSVAGLPGFSAASSSSSWNVALSSSAAMTLNAWNHVAAVRSGSNFYLFLNGALVASTSASFTINTTSSTTYIGGDNSEWNTPNFQGYIDEVRISNGVARWTSNFTPPTTAYNAANSGSYTIAFQGTLADQAIPPLTTSSTGWSALNVQTGTSAATYYYKVTPSGLTQYTNEASATATSSYTSSMRLVLAAPKGANIAACPDALHAPYRVLQTPVIPTALQTPAAINSPAVAARRQRYGRFAPGE